MATPADGPSDRDHLLSRFGRSFTAGTVLFRDGEPADFAYLLQSGRVRLFKQVGAMERSLRVVRAGDLFGESALEPGAMRRSTAVALDDVTAIAVDHATFDDVLTMHPAVGSSVLQQLLSRLRDAEDQIEILMMRDHQSKVVVALTKLVQREMALGEGMNGDANDISLQISPLELAARVGLDVEIVKRVVSQLREGGYVRIQNERVEVTDLETLRELYSLLSLKDQLRGSPDRERGRSA
ncbi:MAG TPA: Crp/Fnr family transcriptional regulator [Polyangiaceae bacterium]|nr:Crp/Fnr family transcriptional regulator [Polyangiaceae bacterium]